MRRLLPECLDPIDPIAAYADLPVAQNRPSVRLNMIASIDGATAIEGVSGGLGGPADREAYLAMRSLADIVLVAAGTARAEGYGPPEVSEAVRAARWERGQAPLPRIAVVSRSCDLDWSAPLFGSAESRPIVVTVAAAPPERRARAAEVADVVIAGIDSVDLADAVAALGGLGARSVLAEGGPTLNAQLAVGGLIDELCLTLSPRLVGGDARRILAGDPVPGAPLMRLHAVHEQDGYLLLRLRPDRP